MQEFLNFWHQQGTDGFIRIFWFYFVFELPRYVLLDYFVLAYYLYKRKFGNEDRREGHKKLLKEMPLVSIIVPGKDEGRNYYRLVKSLEEQTYKNYEIILVDDGSTDDSELIGRKLEREGKVEHFLRNEVRGGKASAANMGLRYSDGEFVVHTDRPAALQHDSHAVVVADEELPVSGFVDGAARHVERPVPTFVAQPQDIRYGQGATGNIERRDTGAVTDIILRSGENRVAVRNDHRA